ncbi:MAG: calcium-binding protein, partial [Betaproteobacteria bacterium]|nr:calcium-binding protein [Betaproteobacteria bacterium]
NVKVSSATNLGSIVAIDLSGDTNTSSSSVIDLTGVLTTAMTLKGVGVGANTLTGGSSADTITGGSSADSITGGSGIDSLSGGEGDDLFVFALPADLFGTAIVDSIAGGSGTDTIRLDTTAAVTMANTVSFSRVSGVEKLVVNGANSNAISLVLSATAFAAGIRTVDLTSDTNVAGINVINASTQADTTKGLSLLGSAGADSITGGTGADTITGGAGADSIVGGTGADSIFGGSGADTIVGEQADALIDGGSETDLLQVGASFTPTTDGQLTGIEAVTLTANGLTLNLATQTEPFTINGFATGTSIIVGGMSEDSITGGSGPNTITGGGGVDTLVGGTGADTFVYNTMAEFVSGNAVIDT